MLTAGVLLGTIATVTIASHWTGCRVRHGARIKGLLYASTVTISKVLVIIAAGFYGVHLRLGNRLLLSVGMHEC